MNENIDLTKILEGCPYGTEFYHSGYGKVWFIGINTELERPIHIKFNARFYGDMDVWIASAGTLNKNYDGECLLFPSKEQRDWSKFVRFWDKPKVEEPKVERFDINTLQPFDKVLVRNKETELWLPNMFSFFVGKNVAKCISSAYTQCIPYNNETKHLRGTTDDCPEYYKWWKVEKGFWWEE